VLDEAQVAAVGEGAKRFPSALEPLRAGKPLR
jgi:hypothetical protein